MSNRLKPEISVVERLIFQLVSTKMHLFHVNELLLYPPTYLPTYQLASKLWYPCSDFLTYKLLRRTVRGKLTEAVLGCYDSRS